MMKLYKEAGTNPFSSCLPILVQAPFLYALYGVLSSVANDKPIGVINHSLLESAKQAHIFGAPLSAKFVGSHSLNVQIVTLSMIVLMSLSQFITQRQLMTKNVDLSVKTPFMQQQKMLMYIFPVMFAVMGINFPVGVLVYWLTTNVWTMGQQLIVIHNNPTPGSKAFHERQERLKKQGRINPDGSVKKTGVLALISGGGKAAAPASAAAVVEESVHVRRQQPRKQSKSQRQAAGAAHAHTGAATKPDEPEDAVPAESAKSSGNRPGGQRQQPKRSGQGGQRPKKKS
jgi:YidC/Oxa1 family membrane protein insertase